MEEEIFDYIAICTMANQYGPGSRSLLHDFHYHFEGLEKVVEWCETMCAKGLLRHKRRDGYVQYILTMDGMNRCSLQVQPGIKKFRLPSQIKLDGELTVHRIKTHGLSDRFVLYDLVNIEMESEGYDELPRKECERKEVELTKRYSKIIVYLLKHNVIHEYSKESGVFLLLDEDDSEEDAEFDDFIIEDD